MQHDAQVAVGFPEIRLDAQRVAVSDNRAAQISHIPVHDADVVVDIGILWLPYERLLVRVKSGIVLTGAIEP